MSKTINLEAKVPLLVKYLSWALICFSSFALFVLTLLNATLRDILADSPSQTLSSLTLLYGGQITNIVSGIAMLHRKNWGRYLLVGWFGLQFLATVVIEAGGRMPLAIYPDLLFCLTVSGMLFSRVANEYFCPKEKVEPLQETEVINIASPAHQLFVNPTNIN